MIKWSSDQIIKLSYSGKDSCEGDSGGPLVFPSFSKLTYYQVGIVSFGSNKCGIGKPSTYTKVTSFLDWIKENLEPWNTKKMELQLSFMNFFIFEKDPSMAHELFPKII